MKPSVDIEQHTEEDNRRLDFDRWDFSSIRGLTLQMSRARYHMVLHDRLEPRLHLRVSRFVTGLPCTESVRG